MKDDTVWAGVVALCVKLLPGITAIAYWSAGSSPGYPTLIQLLANLSEKQQIMTQFLESIPPKT